MARRLALVLTGVIGIAAVFAAPAPAAVLVTTADGDGADTHVSNDSHQAQTTNHGSAASNSIRAVLDTRAKVGMLRFDLSNLTQPVQNVQLEIEITFSRRTRDLVIYGLTDDSADAWDEMAITFSGAPGFNQALSGVNTGNYVFDTNVVTPLTTISVEQDGLQVYASATSAALDTFINDAISGASNSLVTLYLSYDAGRESTDGNPDWAFAAKENASGTVVPRLIGDVVPEPASLALLGIGGLALLRRRG